MNKNGGKLLCLAYCRFYKLVSSEPVELPNAMEEVHEKGLWSMSVYGLLNHCIVETSLH